MDGCRWKFSRCLPTTRPALWPPPRTCTRAPGSPISSSRSPAPRKVCRRLRRRSFAGIPINVTLLFSREQYLAAAEAYLRGVERRIDAGLNPDVGSVASVFISRWDVAVVDKAPGCATRQARHRRRQAHLQGVPAAARLPALAARSQLRRAPAAAAVGQHRHQGSEGLRRSLHQGLAAPFTVNTMPENTLKALADHGEVGDAHAAGWRRLRGSARQFRAGRNRCRCAGGASFRMRARSRSSSPGTS